jgi:hypothetical protein
MPLLLPGRWPSSFSPRGSSCRRSGGLAANSTPEPKLGIFAGLSAMEFSAMEFAAFRIVSRDARAGTPNQGQTEPTVREPLRNRSGGIPYGASSAPQTPPPAQSPLSCRAPAKRWQAELVQLKFCKVRSTRFRKEYAFRTPIDRLPGFSERGSASRLWSCKRHFSFRRLLSCSIRLSHRLHRSIGPT